ncbi:MAG: hypothetical protein LCH96_17375 [Actinobacteria bacterium]|nr:hypothetical protein [Actinomycetota bacterium]
MTQRRTWVLVGSVVAVIAIAAAVVIFWLARTGNPMATATTSAAPTAVDPSKVSPKLPQEPTVSDQTGAVKDATFGSCSTTAGKQEVTGKITSSAATTTDYVVTVSWVNGTSDVLARGVAVLKDIPAGGEKDFTLKADVPEGATTCTFHVVRGTVK